MVCSFSQRLQRPEFIRKTKHSGIGHEDIEYSYVVVRRGPRPSPATTKMGRVGEVGRREQIKRTEEMTPMTQLTLEGEHIEPVAGDDVPAALRPDDGETALTTSDINAALRQEAYSWPRLVFPPLKRSGHIILDGCTAEGK